MKTNTHNSLMNNPNPFDLESLQAMHKQAYTDYLTGVYNRHTLDELIQQPHFSQAMLVLIDLDHLKLINDTYGHTTGDSAIQGIAKKIHQAFSEVDHHIFRLGGDEFLVVWPGSTHRLAYEQATQLLVSCQQPITCTYTNKAVVLSASIGIVEYKQANQNFANALAAADEMVYLAKHRGRNRVEVTLVQSILQLPILTASERQALLQLQQCSLKVGYFDSLSQSEKFYTQLLTNFFGLTIELVKIEQRQYSAAYFAQFDLLINAVSISVCEYEQLDFIPFEVSPLVLFTEHGGKFYSPDQAATIPMGMSRLMYEATKEYIIGSQHFQVFDTLDEAIDAFKTQKVAAILTSSYFFKYADMKAKAVPVYRQEVSNVTIGLALKRASSVAVLGSIMRKYLAAGGEATFIKQTKSQSALRERVQFFLTDAEREVLANKQQISVFLQKNHGTFSRYNRNLQCYTGFVMQVLNYLSYVLDLDYVISEYQSRCEQRSPVIESLYCHEADLAFAIFMSHSREREQAFFNELSISLPFAYTEPVVMTTQNRAKLSLAHVKSIKVGVLANSYVKNYLADYAFECQEILQYHSSEALIAALKNYEIQAMIVSHDTASELVQLHPVRIDIQLPYHVERVLCGREEDRPLIQIINKALVFVSEDELAKF